MSISAGMNFGNYEVLARLGSGGMGEVYRARDRLLERYVAIKALPADFSHDPDRLARFIGEAKILASLNHPNIGAIYGLEEYRPGMRCLILELINGISLSDRIARGPLSIKEVISLCGGIADALEAAHECGVIHRDLKPANVMLADRGGVKVMDFGLARHVRSFLVKDRKTATGDKPDAKEDTLTKTITFLIDKGTVEGTPGYMSPEQIRAEEQDQRTDIFAFGCVLYECLTGQRAFSGEKAVDAMTAALNIEPAWSALPADSPQALIDLLTRCLEKEVSKRLDRIGIAGTELAKLRGTRLAVAGEISSIANNLPQEISSFVGRDKELDECQRVFENSRLLTLTGIGGSGKTRLALRLARNIMEDFRDGVWFIDLAPLTDPDRITQVAATALGLKEESNRPLIDSLISHLRDSLALIIFDNCEHLLEACSQTVKTLLESCGNLKLILTSRQSLGFKGEYVFSVQPLSVPRKDPDHVVQAVIGSESGRLFADRARAADNDFELNADNAAAITEICRRLDGIPLAIELAAMRMKMLTVEQIRSMLGDRFKLLTAGASAGLPRYQTLEATIQWSYENLSVQEQRLFRQLAVFNGGWTLSAVTYIAGDGQDEFAMLDALTRLADKSLVVVDRGIRHEARYTMLETVKQYAMDRLIELDELSDVRGRHFDYYLSLIREMDHQRTVSKKSDWRIPIDLNLENIISAHVWCGQSEERVEKDMLLVFAVRNYWLPSGLLDLGFRITVEALNRYGETEPDLLHGKVLLTAGILAYFMGRYSEGGQYLDKSISIMREKAEKPTLSTTLTGLALIAVSQNQRQAALGYLKEAVQISREIDDKHSLASALNTLGDVYRAEGYLEDSIAAYEETVELDRAVGNVEDEAVALCNLGRAWISRGDLVSSREILGELLGIADKIESKHVYCGVFDVAAGLALARRQWEFGVRIYGASDNLLSQSNIHRDITDDLFLTPFIDGARETLGEIKYREIYALGRSDNFRDVLQEIQQWIKSSLNDLSEAE